MTAIYTFDVFSSLDGFGSYDGGNWGGYWGKQGREFLDRRLALYGEEQRMVFGANTYRQFVQMLASSTEAAEAYQPYMDDDTLQETLSLVTEMDAMLLGRDTYQHLATRGVRRPARSPIA